MKEVTRRHEDIDKKNMREHVHGYMTGTEVLLAACRLKGSFRYPGQARRRGQGRRKSSHRLW